MKRIRERRVGSGREKTTEDMICFRDHLSQQAVAADENRQLPIIQYLIIYPRVAVSRCRSESVSAAVPETITPDEKLFTHNQQRIDVSTYIDPSYLVPSVSFHSFKYHDVNATGQLNNLTGRSRVIRGHGITKNPDGKHLSPSYSTHKH